MRDDDHGLIDWDAVDDDTPPTHEKMLMLADFVMRHRHYLHTWAYVLVNDAPVENTGLDTFIMKLRTLADDFFEPTIFPDAS